MKGNRCKRVAKGNVRNLISLMNGFPVLEIIFIVCNFRLKFSEEDNDLICYFIIVISFIMAWAETWFLDFKVLPREQKARERGELHGWGRG